MNVLISLYKILDEIEIKNQILNVILIYVWLNDGDKAPNML